MSKINPKLNLNKTPQLVDNTSLVYAKNIMLLQDNSIVQDTGFTDAEELNTYNSQEPKYIGEIVGLNNKIYLFQQDVEAGDTDVCIYEFNELTKERTKVKCNWNYNGGHIDGVVTVNNRNEEILTICEYFDSDNGTKVPIKHINLSTCSSSDDETIYTQTPNIPFTNLHLNSYYPYTIPIGVYQFFVRYKIKEDYYTDWFPASGELYSYTQETITTLQGQLNYIDTKKDSSRSFVFEVEHLFNNYVNKFLGFQIGFILSHDDAVVARSWKTFDMNSDTTSSIIKFTYEKSDIKEIDIDELLKTSYEIFNVKNVAYFKNKLYISNFQETDFNPNLPFAKPTITLETKTISTNNTLIIGEQPIINNRWGGKPLSSLFVNNQHVDCNFGVDNAGSSVNVPIISIQAAFKKDIRLTGLDNRKSDLYYIYSGTSQSRFGDNKLVSDFTNSSIYAQDTDTVLQNYVSKNRLSNDVCLSVTDKNNHPITAISEFVHKWYWRSGSINYNEPNGNNYETFNIFHYGLRGAATAREQWKDALLKKVKEKYPSTIITKVAVNGTTVFGESITPSTSGINFKGHIVKYSDIASEDEIKNAVTSIIKNNITGVSSNGTFSFKSNIISGITVEYLTTTYRSTEESLGSDSSRRQDTIKIIGATQKHTRTLTVSVKRTSIKTNTKANVDTSGIKTLMPFTKYEFYIHFVKQNGVATNGYYIGTYSKDEYSLTGDVEIIYPRITDIRIPSGYVSCFITINKVGNSVCRGFNYWHDDNYHYIDCLEADTGLVALSDNVQVYKNTDNGFNIVSSDAEYFSSGNSKDLSMFGNCGCVRWPISSDCPIITNYETLSQEVVIPVSNGKSDKIINIAIEENGVRSVYKINLADKPSNVTIRSYITEKLTNIHTNHANVSYTITAKYKEYYQAIADDLDYNFDRNFNDNNIYYYRINRTYGVPTSITKIDSTDLNDIVIDIDNLENEKAKLLTELSDNDNNVSKKLELSIRYNNLVESVKNRQLNAINGFINKANFESNETRRVLEVAKMNIEKENIRGINKLITIHQELGAIQAAQVATSLTVSDGTGTPQGQRYEAKRYDGLELDQSDNTLKPKWTDIHLTCTQQPELDPNACEPDDPVRLGELRAGSASLNTLANASDETITFLHDIYDYEKYYRDGKYNSKVTPNAESARESIRDFDGNINDILTALTDILTTEVSTDDRDLDPTKQMSLTTSIAEINDIKTNIDNITTLDSTTITTKQNRIEEITRTLDDYKSNLNQYITKTTKGGNDVIDYDRTNVFTVDDALEELTIKLYSEVINGNNPIHELTMFTSVSGAINTQLNVFDRTSLVLTPVTTLNDKPLRIRKIRDINTVSFRNIAKSTRNYFWVVLVSDSSNSEDKHLTKISPYLVNNTFEDYEQMNLPGFICNIKKLDHNHNDKYYINGSDVYYKTVKDNIISLEEVEEVTFHVSEEFFIPSEFNLNCVTLNDTPTVSFRTYTKEVITEEKDEDDNYITKTINCKDSVITISSLISSSILTLPTMFYDYTRHYYSKILPYNVTDFQTTVRSSNTNIDEQRKEIYKFDAEDYYNVPANRGIIVKLFVLANDLFIHNQHALLKFSGGNSILGTEGQISLKEGDIFDSGISFVLDSITGKFGIKEKHHSIVTSEMYIFWDGVDKSVYAFDGKQPTTNILKPIQKMVDRYIPTDVRFANDEQNSRFFINFITNEGNICLSYNFNVNSFVSIHDFDYSKSFSSRNNSYFLFTKYNENDALVSFVLAELSKNIYRNNNDYLHYNKQSVITTRDEISVKEDNEVFSTIDIIINNSYEKIKVINYLNWICSAVSNYEGEFDCLAEETFEEKYAGDYIKIYSDQCNTNLIKLTDNSGNSLVSNNYDLSSEQSFKAPRYNCGIWSFDYFRDVRNTDNYQEGYNNIPVGIDDGNNNLQYREYNQNSSLVHGKYFVIRFIFKNKNFKLENVTLNMNDYDKVK